MAVTGLQRGIEPCTRWHLRCERRQPLLRCRRPRDARGRHFRCLEETHMAEDAVAVPTVAASRTPISPLDFDRQFASIAAVQAADPRPSAAAVPVRQESGAEGGAITRSMHVCGLQAGRTCCSSITLAPRNCAAGCSSCCCTPAASFAFSHPCASVCHTSHKVTGSSAAHLHQRYLRFQHRVHRCTLLPARQCAVLPLQARLKLDTQLWPFCRSQSGNR